MKNETSEKTVVEKQFVELVNMLKAEKGLIRLFSAFYEKYRSYGKAGKSVSVRLVHLSSIEKQSISGFFGIEYENANSITLTVGKFEKMLSKTRFKMVLNEYSFEDILKAYFGELTTKNDEMKMFLKNRKTFFEKFKTAERPELLRRVIEWAESEDNQSNRLYIRFRQDAEALREDLEMASELLKEFPLEEPVYLPIFAATVTKDPHAFDTDKTDKGRFLIYLLQVIRHLETDVPINSSLNAEERNELLLSYNLLKDDLSNYVTIYNVEAKDVDGVESEFLKMAAKQRVALNLPLKEVLRVESFFTKQKRIFVVENSSVASKMMNHATETNSDCSIVCGNGVMNMATILFLDKFVKSGGSIVYSGDFDPEGLLIAQRLVTRYGEESVDLSAFSVELYRKSLSNLIISYERLKKLSKIDDSIPELFEIRLMMMRETRAGYQENYLKDYLSELEKPYKSGLGPDEFLDFFKRSLEFRI